MKQKHLTLRDLSITNGSLKPATISFTPGLNLIIGASATGKTFIFETLDFMLGAKDALREIPEAAGYTDVHLAIDPSHGAPFTLQRAIAGGNFSLTEYAKGRNISQTALRTLGCTHSADPHASLSAYLLDSIGIGSKQLRKNVRGEKKALSFRHIAHLTLINEERIIQQASPILSSHDTENTAEANAFAYFLTGKDDSSIIAQENANTRKTRLAAEEALLESILTERKAELAKMSKDSNNLADQGKKLEIAIEAATNTIVTSQSEISGLEEARERFINDRAKYQSHSIFIQEQLKQLRLLEDYYQTDHARLEAVIEASQTFHDLPEGICALCNQPLLAGAKHTPHHKAFEAACSIEVKKIATLRQDLKNAISDYANEGAKTQSQLKEASRYLQDIDAKLKKTLIPTVGTAQTELTALIETRTLVAQSTTLQNTIHKLEERLARIKSAQKEKVHKAVFEPRVTTSSTSEFCKVVEGILADWKYPDMGTVTFDTEKCDLVIGGKDRANTGKGYRAITYAAFVIGFMKYCRSKSIPHPGFVVLDTPVNPYKGPSESIDSKLTEDVKSSFFKYLADDNSGDQIIVLENQDPPEDVIKRVNYYNFTRNPSLGRYGFFPYHPAKKLLGQ